MSVLFGMMVGSFMWLVLLVFDIAVSLRSISKSISEYVDKGRKIHGDFCELPSQEISNENTNELCEQQ